MRSYTYLRFSFCFIPYISFLVSKGGRRVGFSFFLTIPLCAQRGAPPRRGRKAFDLYVLLE